MVWLSLICNIQGSLKFNLMRCSSKSARVASAKTTSRLVTMLLIHPYILWRLKVCKMVSYTSYNPHDDYGVVGAGIPQVCC